MRLWIRDKKRDLIYLAIILWLLLCLNFWRGPAEVVQINSWPEETLYAKITAVHGAEGRAEATLVIQPEETRFVLSGSDAARLKRGDFISFNIRRNEAVLHNGLGRCEVKSVIFWTK